MARILYDLCAANDLRFSPYCWRVKLSLAHKKLEYRTVPVGFTEKYKIEFSGQNLVPVLDDNGTMAVVLPHGVLFRGAAEGHIRKHLIKEKNYLDAVIGLPANIFYGTNIPTCILLIKKNRTNRNIK